MGFNGAMGKGMLLVLLAGCSMSLNELRQDGVRVEFMSARPARDLALCIARNADNFQPGFGLAGPFPATWREGMKQGTFEVMAKHPAGNLGFAMVADIEERDGGSIITTWLAEHLMVRDMPERIVEPCGAQRVAP